MLCPRSNRVQTRDLAHVISMLKHQISQLARSLDKIFIAREMSLTGSASIQLDSHTNPTWPAPGVNANKARQKWRVERVRDNGTAVTVCCEVLQKQISLIIKTVFSSFIQGAISMGSNRFFQWGETDALIEATQSISVWNFNAIMLGIPTAKISYHTDKMRFPIAHGSERHLVTPIQGKPNVSVGREC